MNIEEFASWTTVVTFIAVLIGRAWKVHAKRSTIFEAIDFVPREGERKAVDEFTVDNGGVEYLIKSEIGIRKINVYSVVYDHRANLISPKHLMRTFEPKQSSREAVICCEIPELVPVRLIEIERTDYSKTQFSPCISGKDGKMMFLDYKNSFPILCFLFHYLV